MDLPRPSRTTSRRALLLAAGLGAVAAAGVGLPRRAAAAAPPVVRPWPAGKPVPALALADLDGKAWRLADLKGRPVLLNFWATWCEPCRAEMPSLQALAARERPAGLAVLSVNYKEASPAIRDFLARVPLSLPILLDADGEAAGAWTPRVFPTSVLVDRGGVPRTSVIGDLDWGGEAARALLAPVLAAAART